MDFRQGSAMEMEDISIAQKENKKLMSELQRRLWEEKEISSLCSVGET